MADIINFPKGIESDEEFIENAINQMLEKGIEKIVVIGLNDENDKYGVAIKVKSMKSSEIVTLLDVSKDIVKSNMK